MARRAMLIGIGGGSGSGKTTLARRVQDEAGDDLVTIVELDSYYHNFAHLSQRERERINFDHPEATDWDLLLADLRALRDGEPIEQPVYDFARHRRADEVVRVEPTPAVIVEGIHCLAHAALRELLEIKVFVDTDPDIRFIRRLRRDILDRDRSIDSVVEQYQQTVRPMYTDHVEPSRRHADIVVPEGGGGNELGIELLVDALVGRIIDAVEGSG